MDARRRHHHDFEHCRYPEERGCDRQGNAGFAAIARGPARAGNREIQAMECERLKWLGCFVANSWIIQNPSFAGCAATMAYLPAQKLAIAVSMTLSRLDRQCRFQRIGDLAQISGAPRCRCFTVGGCP